MTDISELEIGARVVVDTHRTRSPRYEVGVISGLSSPGWVYYRPDGRDTVVATDPSNVTPEHPAWQRYREDLMARLTDQEIEAAYVAKFRREVHTLSDETLDRLRCYGEAKGWEITLGDMDGDELASLCDAEIAGRCIERGMGTKT